MSNVPRPGKSRLTRLDAVRGFAATVVVLGHGHLTHPDVFSSVGQEAVILFFLLSGFVIYYATYSRPNVHLSFGTYFLHRFRRIYPLLFVALGLSYALPCFRSHQWLPVNGRELLGNIFMLQDVPSLKRGVWFNTYFDNSPLWSLSYEWWFYMMFFPISAMLITRQKVQKYLVGALSLIGFVMFQIHPNPPALYLGYFFIWWSGVELAREYISTRRITWPTQLPNIIMLGFLSALWMIPVARMRLQHQHVAVGVDPFLQFRHFSTSLLFLVVGIAWYKVKFVGFRWTLAPFAIVAPITYALYIIHVPVLSLFYVNGEMHLVRFAMALAILVPVAFLLEVVLQPRVNAILGAIVGSFNSRPSVVASSGAELRVK